MEAEKVKKILIYLGLIMLIAGFLLSLMNFWAIMGLMEGLQLHMDWHQTQTLMHQIENANLTFQVVQ